MLPPVPTIFSSIYETVREIIGQIRRYLAQSKKFYSLRHWLQMPFRRNQFFSLFFVPKIANFKRVWQPRCVRHAISPRLPYSLKITNFWNEERREKLISTTRHLEPMTAQHEK
ncbi:hypothetical protein PRIPAC_92376 [Pristionchus pacificus]|uniref:Uncharacterized protein n=1 Tax=Pristionchus pacificus TaxID=54126 RepID=A0A2A6CDG8_PRIPA|nr:hypothetical protein PRIPAC_92376 [Pristionchus pacificus]|eukprot:PDM76157.1 hypothetical protein PRIPAC_39761 [Pristionchus pacificus]